MAKQYVSQRLFNCGSASIAKLHLSTGKSLEELAAMLFDSYRKSCIDDGLEEDWVASAREALKFLEENDAPAPGHLLDHFQYFVEHYEPDGSPRKKNIFGRIKPSKAKAGIHRKENFLKSLKSYYTGALAGV